MTRSFVAIDLGGSSIRCMIGQFDGSRLSISPVAQRRNGPVRTLNGHHWPILEVFDFCKEGLKASYSSHDKELASLGVDAWGVCFALIDKTGDLIANPYYCRGCQRPEMLESIFRRVSRERIFEITGLRVQRLNTLYQLAEMASQGAPALAIASRFLMVPGLINYWLTGRTAVEYTNASTTHLMDVHTRQWSPELLQLTGLPASAFPEIVEPAQEIGELHSSVRAEMGLPAMRVVATASHDTAAAVVAVPAATEKYAYLASGTWGLLGVELRSPIVNPLVSSRGFVNQGGAQRTIRFLHNSLNMWLLQRCLFAWGLTQEEGSWARILALANDAKGFQAFIDTDHPSLLLPSTMPDAVRALCIGSGQPAPLAEGDTLRVILESLAMKYRYLLDRLAECIGWRPEILHVVGGGGRNKMLNQLIANTTGLPVMVGPIEASTIGNIIVQMMATGEIGSLEEGRAIVRSSFTCETYEPVGSKLWEEQYERYLGMIYGVKEGAGGRNVAG